MTWTQPVCATCWNARNPDRPAVSVGAGDDERCCYCGNDTRSGIYIRVDPRSVPFPDGAD